MTILTLLLLIMSTIPSHNSWSYGPHIANHDPTNSIPMHDVQDPRFDAHDPTHDLYDPHLAPHYPTVLFLLMP
jgi:hypothetical protein